MHYLEVKDAKGLPGRREAAGERRDVVLRLSPSSRLQDALRRAAPLACAAVLATGGAALADQCVRPAGALGCWATIQEAADAAAPGELVAVYPGTYAETVVLGADGMRLVGKGAAPGEVVIDGGGVLGAVMQLVAEGIVVRNLSVRNGNTGILVTDPGCRAIDVHVEQALVNGIQVDPGATGVSVVGSLVSGAGNRGLMVEGPGVEVRNTTVQGVPGLAIEILADSALVVGTKVYSVGGGISLSSSGAVLRNNTVSESLGVGISVVGDGAVVEDNFVTWIDGTGFRVNGDGFLFSGNTLQGADTGIKIDCIACTSGLIAGNKALNVYFCPGFTIDADAPGVVVRGNVSSYSYNEGFLVNAPGVVLVGNRALYNGQAGQSGFDVVGDGVFLRGNLALGNRIHGFRVSGTGAVLRGNRATRNLQRGFQLDSLGLPNDAALLVNNVALSNLAEGILVDTGVTGAVLKRNVARGNDPDFCDHGTGTVLGTGRAANRFGTVCGP